MDENKTYKSEQKRLNSNEFYTKHSTTEAAAAAATQKRKPFSIETAKYTRTHTQKVFAYYSCQQKREKA